MQIKKGISLIVLVITIIVIVILAGSVIINISQNNIIGNSIEAKLKNEFRAYDELFSLWAQKEYVDSQGTLDITTVNIDKTSGSYTKNGITTGVELKNVFPGITGTPYENSIAIKGGKLTYVGTDAVEAKYANDLGVLLYTNIKGSNKYNIPYIPNGFYYVGGSWNSGLLISDSPNDFNKGPDVDLEGNQFVWVPVKDFVFSDVDGSYLPGDNSTVKYIKWCTSGSSYSSTTDDTILSGTINEKTQIENFGGFYIGRCEAGRFDATTMVSKRSLSTRTISPWYSINYTDSKSKAESMYTGLEVKSGLVTGRQWDTVMKWIQVTNPNKNLLDSTLWGNYSNSTFTYGIPTNTYTKNSGTATVLYTGASSTNMVNGIYDLAGNVTEWTNDIMSGVKVIRGGNANNIGSSCPGSYKSSYVPTNTSPYIGFRVVLYLL